MWNSTARRWLQRLPVRASCHVKGVQRTLRLRTALVASKGRQVHADRARKALWHQPSLRACSTVPAAGMIPNNVHPKAVGTWEGFVSVNGDKHAMVWRVPATIDDPQDGTEGPAVVFFDYPGMFQYDIPSMASVDGSSELVFTIQGVGDFRGVLNEDGSEATGRWSQAGSTFPLTLKRTQPSALVGEAAANARHDRPQTPRGTPPYEVLEVVVGNPMAAVALSGTFTVPRVAMKEGGSAKPVPTVVLACGSGPHTRNESVFGHHVFWVLADFLTRQGIAVFRYDKRGVGTSTGQFQGSTATDFASDAAAIVQWIRSGAGGVMTPSSVGIVGHSEGTMVAAMVANSLGPDVVNHVTMLGSPGMPGKDLVLEQGYLVTAAEGIPTELLDLMHPFNKKMFDAAASILDVDELKKAIVSIRTDARRTVPEAAHDVLGLTFHGDDSKADEGACTSVTAADMLWLLRYDPRPHLRQLKCPVLALGGAKDLQTPPTNLAGVRECLTENPAAVVKEFATCNHLFQTAATGAVSEYSTISETMQPEVMETIAQWILGTDVSLGLGATPEP